MRVCVYVCMCVYVCARVCVCVRSCARAHRDRDSERVNRERTYIAALVVGGQCNGQK
jgi:hypothetical protein